MTEKEKKNLVALLHQLVMAAVPRSTTEEKYGGTLYTVRPDEKEAQFCGIFTYKGHVQLSFARGVDLDDPDGMLQGGGKYRRHLNFADMDEVDAGAIGQFARAAAKL
ncbi:MAG: DUF1801 domain-containing protein [Pirellulaceae bacterium]